MFPGDLIHWIKSPRLTVANDPLNATDPTGMERIDVERKVTMTGSRIAKTKTVTVETDASQEEVNAMFEGVSDSFFQRYDGTDFGTNKRTAEVVSQGDLSNSQISEFKNRTEIADQIARTAVPGFGRGGGALANSIGIEVGNDKSKGLRVDASNMEVYGTARGGYTTMAGLSYTNGLTENILTMLHEPKHLGSFGYMTSFGGRRGLEIHRNLDRTARAQAIAMGLAVSPNAGF